MKANTVIVSLYATYRILKYYYQSLQSYCFQPAYSRIDVRESLWRDSSTRFARASFGNQAWFPICLWLPVFSDRWPYWETSTSAWCRVDVSLTDVSLTENSWMLRPLNKASLGYCALDQCVPTLDCVTHGSHKAGTTAAICHPIGYWRSWPDLTQHNVSHTQKA